MSSLGRTGDGAGHQLTSVEQHEQRLRCLLILRVLATLAVVFGHASAFYGGFGFTQWPNFPYIQSIAVTVFFCISGYTIAWVCDGSSGSGSSGLGWFVFDRVARLGIPLFPLLIMCAFVEPLLLGSKHPQIGATSIRSLVGNMLFLQWLTPAFTDLSVGLGVQPYGLNRPLWTLSLEFWTYILFAGAYFGFSRGGVRFVPVAASLIAAVVMGGALFGAQGAGLPLIWLLSAALYFALQEVPAVSPDVRLLAFGLIIPAVAMLFVPEFWPANGAFSKFYNFLVLIVFCLLMVLSSGGQSLQVRFSPFERLSGFAYSTYISHYPVLYLLHDAGWLPVGEAGAILATAISLAFGWAFSLPFERNYKIIRQRIRAWLQGLITYAKAARPD